MDNYKADNHQENTMKCSKEHSLTCRLICLFLICCSQIKGNDGINPDSKTDHNCIDQILNREYQRKCGHCIFTDLSNKKAVNDIIK